MFHWLISRPESRLRNAVCAAAVVIVAVPAIHAIISSPSSGPAPIESSSIVSMPGEVPGDVIDPLDRPACSYTANPHGDDNRPGTESEPFATVQRLVDSLKPGQTGCLTPGKYSGDVIFERGGDLGLPITLTTAEPGVERPVLEGRVVVKDSANNVIISGLSLDGRNGESLPSPTINGDNVVLRNNDITNQNTAICLNVGNSIFGVAVGTVIEGNKIHDCGSLPPSNQKHGVYVGAARDTLIRNNLIYANADRGVQLYPDSQRTWVVDNVIDSNGTGVLIAGGEGKVSSGNIIEHNIIANSRRYNVDANWPDGPAGIGNVVRDNCLWKGGIGEIANERGFMKENNLIAGPRFLDPAHANYRLSSGSPCAGLGPTWPDA